MLGDLSGVAKIYLVSGYTDMRRSIDGLMAIVRDTYELDPYSNSLFLFCGKRCDRLKALHFDKDGFVLLYKRLDSGCFQLSILGVFKPPFRALEVLPHFSVILAS